MTKFISSMMSHYASLNRKLLYTVCHIFNFLMFKNSPLKFERYNIFCYCINKTILAWAFLVSSWMQKNVLWYLIWFVCGDSVKSAAYPVPNTVNKNCRDMNTNQMCVVFSVLISYIRGWWGLTWRTCLI